MRKGELSREQTIEIVDINAVEAVEAENCVPTNRVGYNGSCQDDYLIEWSATVGATTQDGDDVHLTAYYYTDQDDEDYAETADGWDNIDWAVAGYEVE